MDIAKEIAKQQQWIKEHGGDLAGYIERYGTKNDPNHFGDGGEAIYMADLMALHNLLSIPRESMPATYVIGSDQYGGKLISVSRTRHRVTWVRVDESGKVNESMTKEFTKRRGGDYYAIGSKHGYLKLGVAKTDLDEGF